MGRERGQPPPPGEDGAMETLARPRRTSRQGLPTRPAFWVAFGPTAAGGASPASQLRLAPFESCKENQSGGHTRKYRSNLRFCGYQTLSTTRSDALPWGRRQRFQAGQPDLAVPQPRPPPRGSGGSAGSAARGGALALPFLEGWGLSWHRHGAGGPRGPRLQGVPLLASG